MCQEQWEQKVGAASRVVPGIWGLGGGDCGCVDAGEVIGGGMPAILRE